MTAAGEVGKLILVPTPIGNLEDLTHRAERLLRECDLIACEDTRHSGRLLRHYQIETPRLSLHAHNEASRSEIVIAKLLEGQSIALITDAGMPMISDPGQRLLQRCLAAGIPYEALPGPSAVVTALAGAGLPTDVFYYGGFLPNKSGQRRKVLENALQREETCAFYESPHRLVKSLEVLVELAPQRLVCVARELSKKFEEFRRDTAETLVSHYRERPPKGEITLIIGPEKLPRWFHIPGEP